VDYIQCCVTTLGSSAPHDHPLTGQTLVFSGRLLSLGRRDARRLAEGLGATVAEEVSATTTMLVVAAEGTQKLRRAEQINVESPDRIRIISEDEFCEIAGVPSPSALRQQFYPQRDLLERYPHVREDHLRYMQKWGLIRPVRRTHGETYYAFPDRGVIRQADAELAEGASFRAVLKNLLAARSGQLAFDFRIEAQPAKVFQLRRRERPPLMSIMEPVAPAEPSSAEQFFISGSILDDGDPANFDDAAQAYRHALQVDPYLVPALINLANIHYARDEIAEAQALYERAIALEADVFEAHFNLGNIYHDLGRYFEAQQCYRQALALNPEYADAHFYLAITLEKSGRSHEAQPHWKAYQRLAPNGEWVDLAKEFSE
jgi:cytochrome c-type biogenesis protein CcmH/NrfG